MSIDEDIQHVEKDIQYFDKMVEGADRLLRPWKEAVKWLIFALVLSNLIWAGVHFYSIYKAYQEPISIDVQQNQEQPDQKQDQGVKGGG